VFDPSVPADQSFRLLFEANPQGVVVHDHAGRVLFANRAAEALLGAGLTSLRDSPRLGSLARPDGAHFAVGEHPVEVALRTGSALRDSLVRAADEQGERWLKLTAIPISERAVPGWALLSFLEDVTERLAAERALSTSEARFRSLFEAMQEGFFLGELIYDAAGAPCDWRFLDVNPAHARIIGMRREEVVGKTVRTLFPGLEDSWFSAHVRAARDREPFSTEGFVADTGRYYENHYYSPKPGQFACIFSDITERKQAEAALRESEARFVLLFDTCPVGLSLTRLDDLRLVEVNQMWSRMFGYAPEESRGRTEAELGIWLAPDAHAAMLARLTSEPVVRSPDLRCRARGGDALDVAFVATRVVVGGAPHVLSCMMDNTFQKDVERALKDHTGELESLIALRTRELRAATAEAERLSQAKSAFLANMSHEIRTPLNGVLGIAAVSKRKFHAQREVAEAFQGIADSGSHLLGLVDEILDFSRMEAGKMRLVAERVDLPRLLEDALRPAHAEAIERRIGLAISLAEELPRYVSIDPLRFRQIVVNLLSNAVKFTERGQVTIRATLDAGQLVLTVADTGIGMSPAQKARLFRPFEQADGSITRRYGGSGLGLAITKRIVDMMGGRMDVASELGGGSCFEVRLPVHVAAAAPVETEAPLSTGVGPKLAGLCVLAVDDHAVNQIVLREMLASEGATVHGAGSGREALSLLHELGVAHFDLVLMDVQMPELDGFQTTQLVHALAPDLPVVGQTAHALAEDRERCLAAGMVDHLSKPIDLHRLVNTVLRNARRRADPHAL
jgi:two-component system sensor histidine kinase/response regulator